jgi:hypothetical protein
MASPQLIFAASIYFLTTPFAETTHMRMSGRGSGVDHGSFTAQILTFAGITKNLSILEIFWIGQPLRVDDFDFDAPRAPTAPRQASRAVPLVRCSFPRSWRFEDRQIADLPPSLRTGDLLLFNDTKVIPARLVGLARSTLNLFPYCATL